MGSSKGGDTPDTTTKTTTPPSVDYGPMFAAMTQMQAMSAATQAESNKMMAMKMMAPNPTAVAAPDWKARSDALKAKILSREYAAAKDRRGRESTIITSPLTDEKVKTTESVLTGS